MCSRTSAKKPSLVKPRTLVIWVSEECILYQFKFCITNKIQMWHFCGYWYEHERSVMELPHHNSRSANFEKHEVANHKIGRLGSNNFMPQVGAEEK